MKTSLTGRGPRRSYRKPLANAGSSFARCCSASSRYRTSLTICTGRGTNNCEGQESRGSCKSIKFPPESVTHGTLHMARNLFFAQCALFPGELHVGFVCLVTVHACGTLKVTETCNKPLYFVACSIQQQRACGTAGHFAVMRSIKDQPATSKLPLVQ